MQNGNREPDKVAKVTIELKDVKTADHDEAEHAHKVATLKRALSD